VYCSAAAGVASLLLPVLLLPCDMWCCGRHTAVKLLCLPTCTNSPCLVFPIQPPSSQPWASYRKVVRGSRDGRQLACHDMCMPQGSCTSHVPACLLLVMVSCMGRVAPLLVLQRVQYRDGKQGCAGLRCPVVPPLLGVGSTLTTCKRWSVRHIWCEDCADISAQALCLRSAMTSPCTVMQGVTEHAAPSVIVTQMSAHAGAQTPRRNPGSMRERLAVC
jgi:hypothetical protein